MCECYTIFISFFQTFTCVVGFGLFHGLTVLPVLLSFIGPEPYASSSSESGLIPDTEISYRNSEQSLNGLKKLKGVKTNVDLRQDITSCNGHINEGFNKGVAAFGSSSVSINICISVCNCVGGCISFNKHI